MSGFVPCEIDRQRQEKYEARRRQEVRSRAAINKGEKVYDERSWAEDLVRKNRDL